MRPRDIKTPALEFFSDAEFRPLFSKDFLILAINVQRALARSWETHETVKRHFGRVLGARALKDLPAPADLDLSHAIELRASNQEDWRTFSKITKISLARCELCGRQLRAIQKAHILSRRFFRSLAFKRRAAWRV